MQRDSLPARRRYTRLAGSADALALARLAQEEHPIAVVSATAHDAQRLIDEIGWFAPQLRVCLLPDWETLPYDQFSPHHDLVSERLATLYRIQRGDFDVAVVPAATALVRLCPPAYIAAHSPAGPAPTTITSYPLGALGVIGPQASVCNSSRGGSASSASARARSARNRTVSNSTYHVSSASPALGFMRRRTSATWRSRTTTASRT